MFIKIIISLLLLIFNINGKDVVSVSNNKLYCYENFNNLDIAEGIIDNNKSKSINNILKNEEEDDLLATITIDKIELTDKPIYKIGSNKNSINKNITILMSDNGIIVLCAHSGYGSIAYFKNLYKLQKGDIIKISKKGNIEKYSVKDIYEEAKDGKIEITKKYDDELILTTCSYNKGKQLIVETEKVI